MPVETKEGVETEHGFVRFEWRIESGHRVDLGRRLAKKPDRFSRQHSVTMTVTATAATTATVTIVVVAVTVVEPTATVEAAAVAATTAVAVTVAMAAR